MFRQLPFRATPFALLLWAGDRRCMPVQLVIVLADHAIYMLSTGDTLGAIKTAHCRWTSPSCKNLLPSFPHHDGRETEALDFN